MSGKSMPGKTKKWLIIGALVALVLLLWAWDASAGLRGTLRAKFDLARGHYAMIAYGLPPGGADEYAHLLKERYGIEFRRIAFCIVSNSIRAYADSYNRVSIAAAQKRFGKTVFEDTWQEAQRSWLHKNLRFTPERIPKYLFGWISDAPAVNGACIRAVKPGVRMEDVVKRCGHPDEDSGTDKYVFVYRIPGQSTVQITAASLNSIEAVDFLQYAKGER